MFFLKIFTRVKSIRVHKRKIVVRICNLLEWGKVEAQQNFCVEELVYKIYENFLEKALVGAHSKIT